MSRALIRGMIYIGLGIVLMLLGLALVSYGAHGSTCGSVRIAGVLAIFFVAALALVTLGVLAIFGRLPRIPDDWPE